MSKKGENIYKRKDGRWEARYEKCRSVTGKIVYGYCYGKTYREAKQKMQNAISHASLKSKAQKDEDRFQCFCDGWLSEKAVTIKQSSYIKYDIMLEKHIKPFLGHFMLAEITTALCSRFREVLSEKESPKMVRDILTVLKAVLKFSQRKEPSFRNDIDIVMPKTVQKEMRVLSSEKAALFIQYLLADLDACKFGIILSAMTGMRIGEICALKWENISLADGTVKVSSTMQRLRKLDKIQSNRTEVVIGVPKSNSSLRTIPLTKECLKLCEKMAEPCGCFVLTGSSSYMEPRALQYRLKKYTEECGLKDVHFHTLRHTFATRCVEVGFEIKSLSEVLGHSSTTITLDRYVHSSLQLKRTNMDKLSGIHGCL